MSEIHHCTCPICQAEADVPEKHIHHQINVLLSRLDEQQRRWYAALEAKQHGHGGVKLDTKYKELIGLFAQPGTLWCEKPPSVNMHDFPSDAVGRAAPYGIYDVVTASEPAG